MSIGTPPRKRRGRNKLKILARHEISKMNKAREAAIGVHPKFRNGGHKDGPHVAEWERAEREFCQRWQEENV